MPNPLNRERTVEPKKKPFASKRSLFDSHQLRLTIARLCEELIEHYTDFSNTILIGLQPRGVFLAQRIQATLLALREGPKKAVPLGILDATFHRDDYRQESAHRTGYETQIPANLDGKRVLLIDDVLYTGRSVRAALDALLAYGRPKHIELLVLVERAHARHLPIQPHYIGRSVHLVENQRILIQLKEQTHKQDSICLIEP